MFDIEVPDIETARVFYRNVSLEPMKHPARKPKMANSSGWNLRSARRFCGFFEKPGVFRAMLACIRCRGIWNSFCGGDP